MMCPDRETQLHAYVDGGLAAADRELVEAHLATCAPCRAALAELRALVAAARRLPRSIEPRRDLWDGIAGRLGTPSHAGRAWWRERAHWRRALAAAAALIVAAGAYRLTLRPAGRPQGRGWVVVQADYGQAAAELARTLEAERGRLRPETIAVVERNLRIIDAAIRESAAALAADSGNAALQQLVAAAYRQKVELLRWATRVAASS